MMMAPVSMQSERERVIDFVRVPFFHDYTTVLLKRPDPNATKWRTLLEPFKTEVIVCLLCAMVALSLLLYLTERFSAFFRADSTRCGYDDVFMYLLRASLMEGERLYNQTNSHSFRDQDYLQFPFDGGLVVMVNWGLASLSSIFQLY